MICDRSPRPEPDIGLLVSRTLCLADDLGLTNVEVQQLIGLPPRTWPLGKARVRCWQPEAWQETRLRHLVELSDLLVAVLGEDAAVWLRTSNRAMFGRTPIAVLIEEVDGLCAVVVRLRSELGE